MCKDKAAHHQAHAASGVKVGVASVRPVGKSVNFAMTTFARSIIRMQDAL
ncbi:MAG: hypothetical protein NVS2B12_11060 [Ktedonobacteraceae bacterium]